MAIGPLNTAVSRWSFLLLLAVAGCSLQTPRPEPRSHVPVLPDHTPVPELEALPQKQPPVAVVLSAETPLYRSVADALGKGDWVFYVLHGGDGDGDEVLARLRRAGHHRAIAVGRRALHLLAATQLDVVYCQVFEPTAAEVVAPDGRLRRGVAPLPDFGAQIDAWRLRQPTLERLGIITGAAYRDVGDYLQAAAQARGLTLQRAVVGSDKELLYVFRRMVPEIDGYVLYPDTSVLSPEAIHELLDYARKHQVQVLTYSPAIYRLGATLLVSTDPREVASKAVAALTRHAGPVEAPLSQVVIEAAEPGASGG